MPIEVHKLSDDPTAAWKAISTEKSQRVIKIDMTSPNGEIPDNKARIVCMSDTHNLTRYIKFDIPDGDIFIHAGDFTSRGKVEEVQEFNNWIGQLPHRYKIVIAGNHELSFDQKFAQPSNSNKHVGILMMVKKAFLGNTKGSVQVENVRQYLTNCIYLEDESIELFGLKIYGTPWQPEFGNWAFNLPRGEQCLAKWNQIPAGIDILITHGPPIGHGDLCYSGLRAGCVELLRTVQERIKPKYHVFGHIHEGYGVTSDGTIFFVNASTCNLKYRPLNPAVVFDLTLPEGKTKTK